MSAMVDRVDDPRFSWTFRRLDVWAFAALHAALFALAFPPFDLWFLAPLSPVPLAWMALRARSAWGAAAATLLTQFPMWMWLVRWIVPVTTVGYPFLCLVLSLYTVLFVWLFGRIGQSP